MNTRRCELRATGTCWEGSSLHGVAATRLATSIVAVCRHHVLCWRPPITKIWDGARSSFTWIRVFVEQCHSGDIRSTESYFTMNRHLCPKAETGHWRESAIIFWSLFEGKERKVVFWKCFGVSCLCSVIRNYSNFNLVSKINFYL